MVKLFFEYKVDFKVKNNEDRLLIYYVIFVGYMDVVIYFLEYVKILYFYLDSNKDLFLYYVVRIINVFMVEYFLEYKLDFNLLNDYFEILLFNVVRFG